MYWFHIVSFALLYRVLYRFHIVSLVPPPENG